MVPISASLTSGGEVVVVPASWTDGAFCIVRSMISIVIDVTHIELRRRHHLLFDFDVGRYRANAVDIVRR